MDTQVVVVGGGPAGMWLAAELRTGGVDVTVLEKDLALNPQARGVTVHPRTLETFDMRGMVETFIAEGTQIPGASFAQIPTLISYAGLDTDFNFILGQPQARTTTLIEARAVELGADIRRSNEVKAIEASDDGVVLSVAGPDGDYTLRAQYVVGCDGTNSMVRESAHIGFPGTDHSVTIWCGDVLLDDPIDTPFLEEWNLNGTVVTIALPSGVRRFIGMTPDDVQPGWPGSFTFEELRSKVKAVLGSDYGMHSPSFLARTGNSSRLADSYRSGRILLAGDSAHRHFPLGGMGMNTSIQDSMNLGWRLARVVRGLDPESTLDTYAAERRQVGLDLLEMTQAQTTMTVSFTEDGAQLRSLWSKMLSEHPEMVDALAERYAGFRVSYARTTAEGHVLEGCRAPNLDFAGTEDRLHTLLRDGQFVLLDLQSSVAQAVDQKTQTDQMRVHVGPLGSPEKRPEWASVTAALIRPDGYVAWATNERDSDRASAECKAALDQWVCKVPATV